MGNAEHAGDTKHDNTYRALMMITDNSSRAMMMVMIMRVMMMMMMMLMLMAMRMMRMMMIKKEKDWEDYQARGRQKARG